MSALKAILILLVMYPKDKEFLLEFEPYVPHHDVIESQVSK